MQTRRRFLGTLAFATGGLLFSPPLGRSMQSSAVQHQTMPDLCTEERATLLNLAATSEALTVAFYYQALTTPNGFFAALPTHYQRYLRATLAADWFHYRYLTEQQSATPTSTVFYFADSLFAVGHFADFLRVMDQLETTANALLLAAMRRLGELNEPVLAEIFGQISAIEAEHRVIGRELAQEAPPPPNNLCFQPAVFACAAAAQTGLAPFLQSGSGKHLAALPDEAALMAAIGKHEIDQTVALATPASCPESVAALLNTAATAEAIGLTFYYAGIQAGFFTQLSQPAQWYLQAALDEERQHLDFLLQNGAAAPPTTLFFPPTVFTQLPDFLALLDQLENLFIGAYLAAIQQFAQLGEFLLAEIAGQILGVEAEHRVLGRVISQQMPPNDLALARASYTCFAEITAALSPFIAGDAQHTQPTVQPNAAAINAAVDRFGCESVALANVPQGLYLPIITR